MCEIFPEVENCCIIFSLRLGLLFISVLAIITGAISLSAIEQTSNASFKNLKNVTEINEPKEVLSSISQLITTGLTGISVVFMFTGVVLLFASLTGNEGFVQMFVWVTFVAVVFGFLMVSAIGFECILKDVCTLSRLDWLSGSTLLVVMIAYLFLWIYFIVVGNSYVLNG